MDSEEFKEMIRELICATNNGALIQKYLTPYFTGDNNLLDSIISNFVDQIRSEVLDEVLQHIARYGHE